MSRLWMRVCRRSSLRLLSSVPSFITTPIFYVNAAPHIGHLYSALLADVAHRWRVIKGADPAVFSTGTDEHGLKIQKVASDQCRDPQVVCDEVSKKFKEMFDEANISYTRFIRTTEKQHIERVQDFWNRLYANGYIYKGRYSGWYSVSDEAYLTEAQVADGPEGSKISLESGHQVEWLSEENYLFKLTAFREQLLSWASTPPYPIVPEFARKLVINWLQKEGIENDLSVSRPRSRLMWGIPVPGDTSQTIYVWLDALVNYLTVSGHPLPNHTWPPTEHVVGKDILRFHAIYWPAFLLAAGLELPKKIVTHSHWLVRNTKMSKSIGNVVDPLEQFSSFGVEQVRYFLLKEGFLHHDGGYSMERLVSIANSDLANTLGNLYQRISSKSLHVGDHGLKFHKDLFPLSPQKESNDARASANDYALIKSLEELPEIVDECYETFQFSKGLREIMKCLYQTNQFIQSWTPWYLVKDSTQHHLLETVLIVAAESVRLSSCLLYPVLPQHCSQLLNRLGFSCPPTKEDLACKLTDSGLASLEDGLTNLKLNDKGAKPPFTKIALESD